MLCREISSFVYSFLTIEYVFCSLFAIDVEMWSMMMTKVYIGIGITIGG